MSTQDLKLFDLLDGLEMTKSQYEWLARRFENMTAKAVSYTHLDVYKRQI